jgi:hypothetical protein
MKSLIVFVTFLALTSATESSAKESVSGRFLTTTGDGNYLALNSTILTLGVIVLLGVALVAMLAVGGGGLFSQKSSQRFAQEPFQEELYNAEETEFQTRYRRSSLSDIASKMAQLEQAFKKYQVTEAECEMYIACEASQVNRHEENGPLAKIIYDIISTFNRAKDGHKWDDRMEGLVQAFEYGTGAQAAGQVDACEPLRNKCFELHASTKY